MHLIDAIILVVYIAGTILVGVASRGRQTSETEYFTGGNGFSHATRIAIVGLSIGATFFSGISLLTYPSITYSSGLLIVGCLAIFPVSAILVGTIFLPRFFALNVRQPYEIIERRFGYPARAIAAVMYLLLRIGWMGVLIYAPIMAIMAGARLSQEWFWPLVLIVGLSSTFYTTICGIRGVLVTDALQFIVMALGVMGPIAYIAWNSTADWTTVTAFLREKGHLQWINWSSDVTVPFTVWSIIAGSLVADLGIYTADQMALQRYLAAGDVRSAQRAFLLNIGGVMLVIALLIVLGLALSVWYGLVVSQNPSESADDVFPAFVAGYLPAGLPGLIFAAILAATMSSMTSGINSLAGCLTLDFANRSKRFDTHQKRLSFARMASIGIGLSATFVAGLVQHLGSIFDIAQALLGVFLGPLLVCMSLAVFDVKVRPWSIPVGMIAGSLMGWAIALSPVFSLWVTPAAAVVTAAIPLATLYYNGMQ